MGRAVSFCSLVAFDGEALSSRVPRALRGATAALVATCKARHGGYAYLSLEAPSHKRTTGAFSQNHAINGYIQKVCIQTGNSFDSVKFFFKLLAIERGWPFETLPNGERYPLSERDATIEHASALIETIKQWCAEEGIDLGN